MFVLGVPYRLRASHVAGVSALLCVSLRVFTNENEDSGGQTSRVPCLELTFGWGATGGRSSVQDPSICFGEATGRSGAASLHVEVQC
jgi:hypothetical protein